VFTALQIVCPLAAEMDVSPTEPRQAHLSDDKDSQPYPVEKSHSRVQIPIYNDVERIDHTDLSFAAILKGTAANPLTTFEKKAALINVEIEYETPMYELHVRHTLTSYTNM
jgi:hypothetical protein